MSANKVGIDDHQEDIGEESDDYDGIEEEEDEESGGYEEDTEEEDEDPGHDSERPYKQRPNLTALLLGDGADDAAGEEEEDSDVYEEEIQESKGMKRTRAVISGEEAAPSSGEGSQPKRSKV